MFGELAKCWAVYNAFTLCLSYARKLWSNNFLDLVFISMIYFAEPFKIFEHFND